MFILNRKAALKTNIAFFTIAFYFGQSDRLKLHFDWQTACPFRFNILPILLKPQ